MKVVSARDAFLSDYEVLQFLAKLERTYHWNDPNAKLHSRKYVHPELQSITRSTVEYLTLSKDTVGDDTDEKDADTSSPITRLTDESFTQLMNELNAFGDGLLKIEKLQIVNQLPRSLVHLYSIVEECDSRFAGSQIEQLLAIIQKYSN